MKRFMYAAMAIAIIAVGCTKSNVVDVPAVQKTPITFETYNGKIPVTKATEVTQGSFENSTSEAPAFKVKAFKPDGTAYMNHDVWCDTKTTGTTAATWDYEGLMYWPNTTLTFVAYGLNAHEKLVPVETIEDGTTTTSHTEFTYTVEDGSSASEHRDLVIAGAKLNVEPTSNAIQLAFSHVLSKVGFQLKTTVANENVDVIIKSIKLNGTFYEACTLDLTKEAPSVTLTGHERKSVSYSLFDTDYSLGTEEGIFDFFKIPSPGLEPERIFANKEVNLTTDVETPMSDDTDCFLMIIPTENPNLSIDVIYEIEGGKEEEVSVPLSDSSFKFEAGKAYEFILELATASMTFEAEVMPWDDRHDDYIQNI